MDYCVRSAEAARLRGGGEGSLDMIIDSGRNLADSGPSDNEGWPGHTGGAILAPSLSSTLVSIRVLVRSPQQPLPCLRSSPH